MTARELFSRFETLQTNLSRNQYLLDAIRCLSNHQSETFELLNDFGCAHGLIIVRSQIKQATKHGGNAGWRISVSCSRKLPLINTPLQRGDGRGGRLGNRFNGFRRNWLTITPLKRGVNEKLQKTELRPMPVAANKKSEAGASL